MIEVLHLNKTYGAKQVLTDVSFTAENGLVTGFVGPNGAGKSTTMRLIAALEEPDSGSATIDGAPFAESKAPTSTLGVYLGGDYLPNHMTGSAYLAYVCRVGGVPQTEVPRLLDTVGLSGTGGHKISSYSLGMRQRIGLAAAISSNPSTLMLDEPINGLDPMGVQWIRGVVRDQAAQGKAVLLSSHLLSELELVADKVVMLDAGRIVRQGMMSQLASDAGDRQTLLKTNDDQRLVDLLSESGISARLTADGVLAEKAAPDKLARFVIISGLKLYRLEEKHETLEELFFEAAAHTEVVNDG
jgi:ABC-2 type transport system ATP-binding protein